MDTGKKNTLTAAFMGAAAGIATGFMGEFFTFPFYHDSTLGNIVMDFARETLLPAYEGLASMIGITPMAQGITASTTPTVSF